MDTFDFEGVNMVFLGGYHDSRFLPGDGLLFTPVFYRAAQNELRDYRNQNEPTIFVTHGPPLTDDSPIDYVPNVGHVGDPNLTAIMNSDLRNIIHIHGHIHEGGGNQKEFPAGVSINVASVTDYQNPNAPTVGLLTIIDDIATYTQLE